MPDMSLWQCLLHPLYWLNVIVQIGTLTYFSHGYGHGIIQLPEDTISLAALSVVTTTFFQMTNLMAWIVQHTILHHSYTGELVPTNVKKLFVRNKIDPDIDFNGFVRLSQDQPRYWFHRFQCVYWPLIMFTTMFLLHLQSCWTIITSTYREYLYPCKLPDKFAARCFAYSVIKLLFVFVGPMCIRHHSVYDMCKSWCAVMIVSGWYVNIINIVSHVNALVTYRHVPNMRPDIGIDTKPD